MYRYLSGCLFAVMLGTLMLGGQAWPVGAREGARASAQEAVQDSGGKLDLRSLGGHPVCEASAALVVPCPNGSDRCLLVGDNEERQTLFRYRLTASGPAIASREPLSFTHLLVGLAEKDREISDIEALAALPGSRVVAVGSHSRNKSCKPRKNRRRMLGMTLEGDGVSADPTWGLRKAKRHTCKRLFGDELDALPGVRREACAAIEAAETAADDAHELKSERDCQDARAFNVEGAAAVPATGGKARIWLGLRTPLVGSHAVLLRRADPDAKPAFDAVALVDLEGWGVRELSVARDWIWVIAGPPEDDGDASFKLWRFPQVALGADELIAPELVAPLPNGSEGLAIVGPSAVVLIDGDKAQKGEETCRVDATYAIVPVSTSRP